MDSETVDPKPIVTTEPLSSDTVQKLKDTHRQTLIDLCMAENKKLDSMMASTIVDFHLAMLKHFGTEEYDHEEALKTISSLQESNEAFV
jgi:hypothetical protein